MRCDWRRPGINSGREGPAHAVRVRSADEAAAAGWAGLVGRWASALEGSGSLGGVPPTLVPRPVFMLPGAWEHPGACPGLSFPHLGVSWLSPSLVLSLYVPGKAMAEGPQQLLEVCGQRLSRFLSDARFKHLAWLREVEEQGMRMLKR